MEESGLFYISPKPLFKFMTKLSSSLGGWKSRYVYIRPLIGVKYNVLSYWVVEYPSFPNLDDPTWAGDFMRHTLIAREYHISELLTEEILVLVGLSSMPIHPTRTFGTVIDLICTCFILLCAYFYFQFWYDDYFYFVVVALNLHVVQRQAQTTMAVANLLPTITLDAIAIVGMTTTTLMLTVPPPEPQKLTCAHSYPDSR